MSRATHVPVGVDQAQHLELASETAKRLNRRFLHDIFPIPEPIIQGKHHRCLHLYSLLVDNTKIMSLLDPTSKMSKSDNSADGCIFLTDTSDQIAKKISRAVTDSQTGISFDPSSRPGLSNLINILALLRNIKDPSDVAKGYSKCSELKKDVIDELVFFLGPVQLQLKTLLSDKSHLEEILVSCEDKAREIARQTLQEMKRG